MTATSKAPGRASAPTAAQAAAGMIAVNADLVGDANLLDVVLSAEFAATGTTVPVRAPAGSLGVVMLRAFAHGGPTTATVVVEGTNDDPTLTTPVWTTLPSSYPATLAQAAAATRYAFLRLRATLAGGTSPTLTAIALVGS